jgi:hypothetical protein
LAGLIGPWAVNAPVPVRSGYTRTLVLPSLTTTASYFAAIDPSWFSYFEHVAVRLSLEKYAFQ